MLKKGNPSIYIDDPDLLDENSSKEPEPRDPEEEGDSKDEDASKERIRVADEKLQMTKDIAEQKLQVEKM